MTQEPPSVRRLVIIEHLLGLVLGCELDQWREHKGDNEAHETNILKDHAQISDKASTDQWRNGGSQPKQNLELSILEQCRLTVEERCLNVITERNAVQREGTQHIDRWEQNDNESDDASPERNGPSKGNTTPVVSKVQGGSTHDIGTIVHGEYDTEQRVQ